MPEEWWGPFAVWEGGLGIWGGIAGGVLVGGIVAQRSGANVPALLDAAAPGLLVAQAIGRIGNWWNQELFGEADRRRPGGSRSTPRAARTSTSSTRPSTRRSSTRRSGTSARPALLLVLDRLYRFRPPALFALYVALYTGFRFYLESLRIDPSEEFLGLRVNAWVSAVLFVGSVLFFIWWQFLRGGRTPAAAARAQSSRATTMADPARPRPTPSLVSRGVTAVRELELDLDAFEGPFDLLLTLLLKEELEPAEIDMAAIVVAFVERLAERDELDLEACGEFLVLIAALLELKARALFPDEEAELAELEPEEAAEELARRLAEYRRMKEAAGWLAERLAGERDRYFRVGPAPLAPRPERKLAPQDPEQLAATLRLLARAAAAGLARAHGACASRRSPSSSSASAPCCAAAAASTSTRRSARSRASTRRSRSSRCSSCARPARSRSSRRRRSRPIRVSRPDDRKR